MIVFETPRLHCRHFVEGDAPFMLGLLNDPGWLRFIGDREVRTVEEAQQYLRDGAIANYANLGFGFYLLELKDTGKAIGMCGLAKRDYLDAPDLGFALLSEFEGHGYAFEAAASTMAYALAELKLNRLLATTRLDNARSSALLERLGMRFVQDILHPDGDRYLKLYEIQL